MLINSYDVPRSLVEPSKITSTRSISKLLFSSSSFNFFIIFFACLLSASFPSPRPGLSHNIKLSSSYLVISIVSGSTPTPTFATSISNNALIVELLPQPVAPVIIRFIFCSFKCNKFFINFAFSESGIFAFSISSCIASKIFFSFSIVIIPFYLSLFNKYNFIIHL